MQELKDYIENWIKFISKKQDAINGFPVCPYASRAKYEIIDSTFYAGVKHALDIIDNFDIVIINVSDENFTSAQLDELVNQYNSNLKNENIWLFADHPEAYTDINGIPTSNGKYALVLVQRLDDLTAASDHLKQNTNYYEKWSSVYYDKIVISREL
jgi:hypothetical protein